jgi:hypothetical protein
MFILLLRSFDFIPELLNYDFNIRHILYVNILIFILDFY